MADNSVNISNTGLSWAQKLRRGQLSAFAGTWVFAALAILLAAFIGLVIGYAEVKGAALAVALVICVPGAIISLVNPKIGLALLVLIAFFAMGLKRMLPGDLPLGLLVDLMALLAAGGVLLKVSKTKDFSFAKSAISTLVIIWVAYNLLQLVNPIAPSRMAWFYSVRSLAGLVVTYFVAAYAFNNLKTVKWFSILLVGLALLMALYGLFQEFIGFRGFEYAWMNADAQRLGLIFQWGRFRIFSFISDPTTFGILMAFSATFLIALLSGKFKSGYKLLFLLLISVLLLPMVYSGTRTAYVLVPIGFAFIVLLTMKRSFILVSVVGVLMVVALIQIPTSNPNLYRLQSAFKPMQDASLQVRLANQENIQPFIKSNPFGAGLGTTGRWGLRFSPWHHLAGFPPDSTYVRVAVEQGWIGLLLYLALMFTALAVGIKNYFRIKNSNIKALHLAFFSVIVCLVVANYPQESATQLPNSIVFYISLAAIVSLPKIDQRMQEEGGEDVSA